MAIYIYIYSRRLKVSQRGPVKLEVICLRQLFKYRAGEPTKAPRAPYQNPKQAKSPTHKSVEIGVICFIRGSLRQSHVRFEKIWE